MIRKIRIKNFGPIAGGFSANSCWIEIPKVTLFCGPQGSGKSSVTKLISLFSWLEKSVYRNPDLKIDADAFAQALEWQNIYSYLKHDTEIEYRGGHLHFSYVRGKITAEQVFDVRIPYVVPKISYMPAERNFASIVRNASRVEGLPRPLVDMQLEFDRAKNRYAKGYRLPANGYRFEYDKEPWIVNGDASDASRTRLAEASSGLQSLVPMLLVSSYLNSTLAKTDDSSSLGLFYDPGTTEKKARTEEYVGSMRNRADLTADQKRMRLELYFAPGRRFLNIVEEPEQNLYPETQRDVVNALVSIANANLANELILSTHSPYVVNQLVTAALAASVESKEEVEKLFPVDAAVPQSDMRLYELDGKGSISLLGTPNGIFDDKNQLNSALRDWNELFDRLLAIKAMELRKGNNRRA